jgi:hypothetical protein
MSKLIYILITIGIISSIFSALAYIQIWRHIRQFKSNYRFTSSLTDQKYFELKTRQDFIISIGSILIALLTLIGYGTLNDIKKEYEDQAAVGRNQVDSLTRESIKKYLTLDTLTDKFKSTIKQGLLTVSVLKQKVIEISKKDVIRQNIYIIDPLRTGDYKQDQEEFRTIYFKDLLTISGKHLPNFSTPPSLICFSTTFAVMIVKDVTSESFKVRSDITSDPTGENIKFSIWVSQKPNNSDFSNDFSPDFK